MAHPKVNHDFGHEKRNNGRLLITRSQGTTPSEKYLKQLCDRTFLSLWSYSGVYRDQRANGVGDGKELCDLLVVFGEHLILFSDKHCVFPNTGDVLLDWRRWYRRAVLKSAEQIYGAERWIREHPDRLFLDRACTEPFPIELPSRDNMVVHRIVIAHGAAERCKEEFGGSGSLMVLNTIVADMHLTLAEEEGMPFTIGRISPAKGYIHVLDDVTVDILLRTLDTISDFVGYLIKKERFLSAPGRTVFAAGEEDLLSLYMSKITPEEEHDFVLENECAELVILEEGRWERFTENPQLRAWRKANHISYLWDFLIERFNQHILDNSQHVGWPVGISNYEKAVRMLARENRLQRRFLAAALWEFIHLARNMAHGTRVVQPVHGSNRHYVFITFEKPHSVPDDKYREIRRGLLEATCQIVRLRFPEARHIVGIATEPLDSDWRSEDLVCYDATLWTKEDEAEARKMQAELNILTAPKWSYRSMQEYPAEEGEEAQGETEF